MRYQIGIVLVTLAAFTGGAMADMAVKMTGAANTNPYYAEVVGTSPILGYQPGQIFATFCLERKEFFYSGHVYDVTIEPYAIAGGPDNDTPGDGNDVLGISTAWLYSQYLDGNLAGYSAKDVQKVIWYLEDELGLSDLTNKQKTLKDLAVAGGQDWGNDYHGVQVMNLWGRPGDFNPAQSQIIRDSRPPVPPPVPVPGAVILGLIGLGALGWLKRRVA